MEKNQINHNTKLFISHDAPQKGANFPIGIQYTMHALAYHSIASMLIYTQYMRFKEWNPATKQVALYHVDDGAAVSTYETGSLVNYYVSIHKHSLYYSFFNELYDLNPQTNGYPQQVKNIAISNGSKNGIKQTNNGHSIYDGEILLRLEKVIAEPKWVPWPFCCGWWCGHGCWTAESRWYLKSRATFDNSLPIAEIFAVSKTRKYYNIMPITIAYDYTPGSYLELENMLGPYIENNLDVSIVADKFCFIPTISSLDLDIDPFDSFNTTSDICNSNFDEIYSENNNIHHFELTDNAKNFIISNINLVSNGSYYSNIDDIVISNKQYTNETSITKAKNSITTNGDVIIDENSNISYVSGSIIRLKPGFRTKSGARFTAKIRTINFNECGINKNIITLNENSNYIDIDNVINNDYENTLPKLNDTLNTINIYPNPTNKFINILSNSEIIKEVRIIDAIGLIIFYKTYDKKNIQIDISRYNKGIFNIIIITKNNNIYNKKAVFK